MNSKKIFSYVAGVLAAALLAYLLVLSYKHKQTSQTSANAGKIQVVASFYPLADFSKNIGGNFVNVTNITPAGAEPHDYEPTPQDIAEAYNARLFIFNGNGVDAWADKIHADLNAKGVATVRIADHLNSLKNNSPDENLQYDPHFWLDPVNVQT